MGTLAWLLPSPFLAGVLKNAKQHELIKFSFFASLPHAAN